MGSDWQGEGQGDIDDFKWIILYSYDLTIQPNDPSRSGLYYIGYLFAIRLTTVSRIARRTPKNLGHGNFGGSGLQPLIAKSIAKWTHSNFAEASFKKHVEGTPVSVKVVVTPAYFPVVIRELFSQYQYSCRLRQGFFLAYHLFFQLFNFFLALFHSGFISEIFRL